MTHTEQKQHKFHTLAKEALETGRILQGIRNGVVVDGRLAYFCDRVDDFEDFRLAPVEPRRIWVNEYDGGALGQPHFSKEACELIPSGIPKPIRCTEFISVGRRVEELSDEELSKLFGKAFSEFIENEGYAQSAKAFLTLLREKGVNTIV